MKDANEVWMQQLREDYALSMERENLVTFDEYVEMRERKRQQKTMTVPAETAGKT